MKEILVDNRGLACPQPVINTKKALDDQESWIVISLVDNQVAKENVTRLATSLGYEHSVEEKEELYYVTIGKALRDTDGDKSHRESEGSMRQGQELTYRKECDLADISFTGKQVILISSEEIGTGSPDLGRTLMRSFLYAASEAVSCLPIAIVLINGGTRLALEDSPCFTYLSKLVELGVDVLLCGICVDFLGLSEHYRVGRISNMYEIYELMHSYRVLSL